MLIDWLPLIFLGFGLGLMHALDADHVMAVSALANQKPSLKRTLLFSAYWALGHGGVLLLCGVLLFGLGLQISEYWQHVAELSVGVLLIVLGLSFFWKFRQQKIALRFHRHDDIVHTHWSNDEHGQSDNSLGSLKSPNSLDSPSSPNLASVKSHQPVMIGILHGLAGSAPALALIPAVASGQLSLAISYLLVFSVGVVLSMLFFGLSFSWLQKTLYQHYEKAFVIFRHAVASLAIALGSFWIFQSL